MSHSAITKMPTAFQLKGNMYTLTTLFLQTDQLSEIEKELTLNINKLPHFFKQMPIVLDLSKLTHSIDLPRLIQLCESKGLIVVGLRALSDAQREIAQKLNKPVFAQRKDPVEEEANFEGKSNPTPSQPPKKIEKQESHPPQATSRIINEQVRSGQQVVAPHGDLIILGQVSHGAELLAKGNIHVYGALRGRALAGIHGDHQARIFCRTLDAELVSIAGAYLLKDDMEIPSLTSSQQMLQVCFAPDQQHLRIEII